MYTTNMKLIVPAALMLLISDPGTVSAQEPRLRGVATAVFEEQVNKATAISSNPHGTSHSPDEDSSPDSNSPDEDYDDYDDDYETMKKMRTRTRTSRPVLTKLVLGHETKSLQSQTRGCKWDMGWGSCRSWSHTAQCGSLTRRQCRRKSSW